MKKSIATSAVNYQSKGRELGGLEVMSRLGRWRASKDVREGIFHFKREVSFGLANDKGGGRV